jgi:hypothetical protein
VVIGHAAAPPRKEMNSRRPIELIVICSSMEAGQRFIQKNAITPRSQDM